MKSKLFVPGTRPELFSKALDSAADGICLDLEDAVSEPRKDEARHTVRELLQGGSGRDTGKTLIVRINAMDTPHFEQDVLAVVQPGVHLINLPKPESAAQVRTAVAAIRRAEMANGVAKPVGLLLNIETPVALRNAAALALADARVVGLQLGLGDLFEPLGIARREPAAIQQAMFATRVAAGEAGVYAYDSAFADIRDAEGFRAEAMLSRRLGFLGKTCIHPSQVAIANEVFRPTDDEIAHAVKVIEATRDADAKGVGAYVVEGKMIDIPFVRRAHAIVASARSLGLLAD
ncbi:CoA ester lyase [Variovorax rhizosphaerae]|uniref:CoA ester lyase n=1 Tax=Variovorax rhizosphaerae TaxID=1836200 RepID=A0ABU8WSE0_9BURK